MFFFSSKSVRTFLHQVYQTISVYDRLDHHQQARMANQQGAARRFYLRELQEQSKYADDAEDDEQAEADTEDLEELDEHLEAYIQLDEELHS